MPMGTPSLMVGLLPRSILYRFVDLFDCARA
jgi:hypothetical protein